MDEFGAVLGDVMVACVIRLVTVLTGAVFFWKLQETTRVILIRHASAH